MAAVGLVDVHGVVVRWSWHGLEYDPVEPLLARFPSATSGRPPGLTVDIGPTPAGAWPPPESQGYRSTCFFGPVLGYTREGDFLLSDGASRAWVSGDGTRIKAWAAPPDRTRPRTFSAGMLFIALMRALRHHGLFHLHAGAAITAPGDTWLIVGRSGAGKTTTTLALVQAGLGFLGDDSLLLRQGPDALEVLPLPLDFHLAPLTVAAFSSLQPRLGETVDDGVPKRRLDPHRAFERQARDHGVRPTAIVLPRVQATARTAVEPCAPAEALAELLHASALLVVEGMADVRGQMALLESLVAGASTWRLTLGADALTTPEAISLALRRQIRP